MPENDQEFYNQDKQGLWNSARIDDECKQFMRISDVLAQLRGVRADPEECVLLYDDCGFLVAWPKKLSTDATCPYTDMDQDEEIEA